MSNTPSLSASDRISMLLDDSSFVEIGAYVTARNTDFNIQDKDTPKDGVITGYGVIDGNLVYVYSQDAKVLGGSIGEMHAKKIANLYDMAMKMGAPVIGLIPLSSPIATTVKKVATRIVTLVQSPSSPSVKFTPLSVPRTIKNTAGINSQPRFR